MTDESKKAIAESQRQKIDEVADKANLPELRDIIRLSSESKDETLHSVDRLAADLPGNGDEADQPFTIQLPPRKRPPYHE